MLDLFTFFAAEDTAARTKMIAQVEARWSKIEKLAASAKGQDIAKGNPQAYYDLVCDMAGGREWYDALIGRSPAERRNVAAAKADEIAARRDAGIKARITAAGIAGEDFTIDGDRAIYGRAIISKAIVAGQVRVNVKIN